MSDNARDCRLCTEYSQNFGKCSGFLGADCGPCGCFSQAAGSDGDIDPETGNLAKRFLDKEQLRPIREGYSPAERSLAMSVQSSHAEQG